MSEIAITTENQVKPGLSKWLMPFGILILVLVLDQSLKYWVKNNMILHTEKKIFGDWFMLHFTENEGMAFGLKFFGVKGKYALTILRIAVSIFGFWFLIDHIKKNAGTFFLICVALILGGAIGNIIDCVFYGVFYQDINLYRGGYMLGWVVDMLYFPIIETHYPSWSPIKPGQDFVFFSPVFNIADAAISIGVISIVVFQKKFFHKKKEEVSETQEIHTESISTDLDNNEQHEQKSDI